MSPVVSSDEAPVGGGLGTKSLKKLKQFADIVCLQTLTAETIKFCTRFLISVFDGVGLSDIAGS